jgi:phage tail P2-like protein
MTSLLPPNATRLERGLEAGLAPLAAIDTPIEQLWDPATCAIDLLPWLAYSLSVDSWDPEWSEATKRDAVARSIELHRVKGTRASVEAVLARFDELASVVEWHEASPRQAPHTFEVHLPIVAAPGVVPSGARVTAAFAERIVNEVARAKPLREHFGLVQSLALTAGVAVQGTARLASYRRQGLDAQLTFGPEWDDYLQTEDGEPLQAETAAILDTAR